MPKQMLPGGIHNPDVVMRRFVSGHIESWDKDKDMAGVEINDL